MVTLIFSPPWFYGIDALFEFFAVLATALLSFYSYKLYSFNKRTSYKYFSFSFLLISLSFIFKIITNMIIYFPVLKQHTIGFFTITYRIVTETNVVAILGLFIYHLLMLLGLFGIYWIIGKSREKNKFLLLLYFVVLSAFFSTSSYLIFHITAAVFLVYISYLYYTTYYEKKKTTTYLVFLSFFLLFLSQIIFIFIFLDLRIYVFGEIIQLAGYLLLLYEYYLLARKI